MANPLVNAPTDSPPRPSAPTPPPDLEEPSSLPSEPPHRGADASVFGPIGRPTGSENESTRRLRAQYAEISQLAGGLAHEVRNPLSTLSLNLDLLVEDLQGSDSPRDRRLRQRADRLKREVQRLQDILENFLRFARIQELKLAENDLNLLVEELCDFYEPQAATQRIVVRTHFATDLPPLLVDADLFKQALLNLILNAEHAMPEGGELILTTRLDGDEAVLEVTDTGVGMTEDLQARIFDPFFSTRPGGSGLGLPTARKIVEAHGGTIEVQSVPGKGSRFAIRLPTPASSRPPASQPGV